MKEPEVCSETIQFLVGQQMQREGLDQGQREGRKYHGGENKTKIGD